MDKVAAAGVGSRNGGSAEAASEYGSFASTVRDDDCRTSEELERKEDILRGGKMEQSQTHVGVLRGMEDMVSKVSGDVSSWGTPLASGQHIYSGEADDMNAGSSSPTKELEIRQLCSRVLEVFSSAENADNNCISSRVKDDDYVSSNSSGEPMSVSSDVTEAICLLSNVVESDKKFPTANSCSPGHDVYSNVRNVVGGAWNDETDGVMVTSSGREGRRLSSKLLEEF